MKSARGGDSNHDLGPLLAVLAPRERHANSHRHWEVNFTALPSAALRCIIKEWRANSRTSVFLKGPLRVTPAAFDVDIFLELPGSRNTLASIYADSDARLIHKHVFYQCGLVVGHIAPFPEFDFRFSKDNFPFIIVTTQPYFALSKVLCCLAPVPIMLFLLWRGLVLVWQHVKLAATAPTRAFKALVSCEEAHTVFRRISNQLSRSSHAQDELSSAAAIIWINDAVLVTPTGSSGQQSVSVYPATSIISGRTHVQRRTGWSTVSAIRKSHSTKSGVTRASAQSPPLVPSGWRALYWNMRISFAVPASAMSNNTSMLHRSSFTVVSEVGLVICLYGNQAGDLEVPVRATHGHDGHGPPGPAALPLVVLHLGDILAVSLGSQLL